MAEKPLRVLVADDIASNRTIVGSFLAHLNCIPLYAEDGVEAVDMFRRESPDVVLMDVNMPRMNGIEATREIRQRWPQTRIIGLSVQDDETTAKSMLDAGASFFVSKSGDSERMIAAILSLTPRKAQAALALPQTAETLRKSQLEIPGLL